MDEYFKISLHDPRIIANLRNNYIKIDPGHEYTILITPVGTIADESVKSISPAARKCLFWSEFNSTDIFSYYSETGNAYKKDISHRSKNNYDQVLGDELIWEKDEPYETRFSFIND